MIWLIILSPFLLSGVLAYYGFTLNTAEFLGITVQLVWGILFAIGGGLIYLSSMEFSETKIKGKFLKSGSEAIKNYCFPIIFHTLTFILLCLAFPLRQYIRIRIEPNLFSLISSVGDSLLFSFMFIPGVASVLVGAWCVYVALYGKPHIETK